ncbi:MAG TPA: ZIP family metal transporter [Bryobacteraceae bacterium]|nr:ZIP family metal transporter [Bryobacteraceae bacterium]
MLPVFLIFLLGAAGAAAGMWLESIPRASKAVVLFSGIVLAGMSFFWVMPEIADHFGWMGGLLWVAVGFLLLWIVNRYLYPVCPSCTHTHDHHHCSSQLHGFAVPLMVASGLHSFMDGWSLAASNQRGLEDLQLVFLVGIAIHKLPEGLALGGILRAAMDSPVKTLLAAVLAQSMALAGFAAEAVLAPHAGPRWLGIMLGLAGGTFLYLGYHALESVYQQRGHQHAEAHKERA